MTKIIAKSVVDKVAEWKKEYEDSSLCMNKLHFDESEVYCVSDNKDFLMLVVSDSYNAVELVFRGMDIDKTIIPFVPETYDFYAWIEMNCDHVDADSFHRWVENNEYDEYFFSLYAQWLYDNQDKFKPEVNVLTPDYKEQTLAETIKSSFKDVFDEKVWSEVLTKAFHKENSGQGIWLVRSDSSFYEKGYAYTCRTDNHAYIIMVNSNIWSKVVGYVKREGFKLWHGAVCVYGSGCAQGERVTLD